MATNASGAPITSDMMAKVRDIDFVDQFSQGVSQLLTVLGIYDVQPLQAGYQIKRYKIEGNLAPGNVFEGEDIPLSVYRTSDEQTYEVKIKQYRKQTTKQAILHSGFANAVGRTDDKMVRDIQGSIRKEFFTFFTNSTGQTTVEGAGLQEVAAQAYGELANEMSKLDTDGEPIFFANPLDLADYLSQASINGVETAFGFQYLRNFLGLGVCIFDANIPQGKIFVTPRENINAYTVDLGALNQGGFNYEMDETGLIGVHHQPVYTNGTCETIADTGLTLFPEVTNFIIEGTIKKPAAAKQK